MAKILHTIDDFGEKIGGARKDLRGNFTVQDIIRLTPIERTKVVRKDMVWPTPDYVQMVKEFGYSTEGAAMVKMLRDSFPAAPIVREGATEEAFTQACELYVETLNVARRISEAGKTPQEISRALRVDPGATTYLVRITDTNTGTRIDSGALIPKWRDGPMSTMALSWRQYSDLHDAFSYAAVGSLDSTTRRMLRKNPAWPEGTSLAEGWIKKVGLSVRPQADRYVIAVHGSPLDEDGWRFLGRPASFTALMDKSFGTAEEAQQALRMAADKRYADRRLEAKQKHQELMQRANGVSLNGESEGHRRGPEWRSAPAVTQDYLKTFRLRGGEFGLWVNQGERQEVLDRGYDSLRDLADVMQCSSETISLGGTLAIAFGARGHGGRRPAAAHYEPGRKVINLTKPHGEGCLAHEWAHALDHYLGERAMRLGILRVSAALPFLSNGKLDRALVAEKGQSEEVKFLVQMREIMDRIQRRPAEQAEVLENQAQFFGVALQKFATDWKRIGDRYQAQAAAIGKSPEAIQSVIAKHEEIRQGFMSQTVGSDVFNPSLHAWQRVASDRSVTEVVGSEWMRMIDYYSTLTGEIKDQYNETKSFWKPRIVDSNYRLACVELDKLMNKEYFALPHEMFARSFEAYVAEHLKSRERKSPYLVAGASGAAFPADKERLDVGQSLAATLERLQQYVPSIGFSELISQRQAVQQKFEQSETPRVGMQSTIRQIL